MRFLVPLITWQQRRNAILFRYIQVRADETSNFISLVLRLLLSSSRASISMFFVALNLPL